jgi:tetratricopeptide (TPR) repeat protein
VNCDHVERGNLAEEYLLGRLPEQAASEFEAHYFDCRRCLAQVEDLEAARAHLLSAPAAAAPGNRLRRAMAAVAAAAVIVIAVGVIRNVSPPEGPPDTPPARNIELPGPPPASTAAAKPDLRALGAIVLPAFDPPRLRTSPSAARRTFLQAMEQYRAGDCGSAIAGLQTAVEQDPESVPAHFFLAVCSLHLNRNADAVPHLKRVLQAGDSAYLEDAHFFLAKAHIRQGDVASARSALQSAIALDGDRRSEASSLLAQLR